MKIEKINIRNAKNDAYIQWYKHFLQIKFIRPAQAKAMAKEKVHKLQADYNRAQKQKAPLIGGFYFALKYMYKLHYYLLQ